MDFIREEHLPQQCRITLYDLIVEGERYSHFVSLHSSAGGLVEDAIEYLDELDISLGIEDLHELRFHPVHVCSPPDSRFLYQVRLLLEDTATVGGMLNVPDIARSLNLQVGLIHRAIARHFQDRREGGGQGKAEHVLTDDVSLLVEFITEVVRGYCPSLIPHLRVNTLL